MKWTIALMISAVTATAAVVPLSAQVTTRDTMRTSTQSAPRNSTNPGRGGLGQPAGQAGAIGTPNRDIVLEVPNLSVDTIALDVDSVRAKISLDARVANLVRVSAGADVRIDSVHLEIDGVLAEAYLYVDLDNVARIVNRVFVTLNSNPDLLEQLLSTVNNTVGTVGGIGNTALQPGGVVSQAVGTVGTTLNQLTQPGGVLSQTVNQLGQTVQMTLGSTGDIVQKTLNATGQVVSSNTLGNVLQLPVLKTVTGTAGQVIKQVRTTAGGLIEYTVDSAGKLLGARIVNQ
jgi:hypothetical protein